MVMGDLLLRVRVSSLQTRHVIRGSILLPRVKIQDLMERMTPELLTLLFYVDVGTNDSARKRLEKKQSRRKKEFGV